MSSTCPALKVFSSGSRWDTGAGQRPQKKEASGAWVPKSGGGEVEKASGKTRLS